MRVPILLKQMQTDLFERRYASQLGSRRERLSGRSEITCQQRRRGGLLDEFEGNSRRCIVKTTRKGAVHHPVGKINVHVKRAVIARLCWRFLAFEFLKRANFKPVISGCLDPLDGAGAACLLDELYRLSRLIHQVVLKCVAHLKFGRRIAMAIQNYADSNHDHD